MTTVVEIKKVIYQIINSVGEKAIWVNQNSPKPKGDFVTLQLSAFNSVVDLYTLSPDADGIARFIGHVECTLMIQAFGQNSLDRLQNVRIAFSKQAARKSLHAAKVSFIDSQSITDLSYLSSEEYEPRAQIELRLRFPIESTDDVGFIQTVNAAGHIYEAAAKQTKATAAKPHPPIVPELEPIFDINLTINASIQE